MFAPQYIDGRLRFAIFVQNPYLDLGQPHEVLKQLYLAADKIMSISEDTERMLTLSYPSLDPARILRVPCSISEQFLTRGSEMAAGAHLMPPCISLMPRKLPCHAELVCSVLREHIPPRWQITPIHNVTEMTLVTMLASSKIFLSFSDLEGLGAPPLEAALAGNAVIGYTGQGGREYWDRPNFQAVENGDIRGFVMAAKRAVEDIDTGRLTRADLAPGIERLAQRFSLVSETAYMHLLIDRIEKCFGYKPFQSAAR